MTLQKFCDSSEKLLVSQFSGSEPDMLYLIVSDKYTVYDFSEHTELNYAGFSVWDDKKARPVASLHVIDNNIIYSKAYKTSMLNTTKVVMFLECVFLVKNNILAMYPPPGSWYYLYQEKVRDKIRQQVSCHELEEIFHNHDNIT